MGNVHVPADVWPIIERADASGEVIDHQTAKRLCDAYTWGWGSCWFAERGDIFTAADGYRDIPGGPITWGNNSDPITIMDQSFFGWWMESDVIDDVSERDKLARRVFRAYITQRVERGELGEIDGWRGWPRK